MTADRRRTSIATLPSIAVHGGAGNIHRSDFDDVRAAAYRAGLAAALETGYDMLMAGGRAIDAVEAAVVSLEDCPLFNAGRGAVLNMIGVCELDAAIMDGKTLAAGAIIGVQGVRNPIHLARAVMASDQVLLTRDGAEALARRLGLPFEPPDYFITPERLAQQQAAARREHGTVGAVALDSHGDLAAATSTGGITNKVLGRVGDSPIIGAGTYASNETCAVSCTGRGEYFIRLVAGHQISNLVGMRGMSVDGACKAFLDELAGIGGDGGVIAIGRDGDISLRFNTPGMHRGRIGPDGEMVIALFEDEEK